MPLLRFIPLLFIFFLACERPQKRDDNSVIAFTGATIIYGTGGEPIQNGVLLIHNGRIVDAGTKDKVQIPDDAKSINVSGKTIIPGLINTHGHVGDVKGIEGGHYSTQNINDNLSIYARYGITTVVSLGNDRKEAVPLRDVNDTTMSGRARLYIAGEIINGETPEEAVKIIESNDKMGVDFMKIRVDDQLGTSPKLSENIYREAIKKSHELGYKLAAHMYYLEDAKRLIDAGTDILAHSIRDLPVDQEFIKMIKEKKASYCPTLTRELSTFVYSDTASFFSDPFFTQEFDSTTIHPLLQRARQLDVRNSKAAQTFKRQLPIALGNLKVLHDNGVPIVMGTDSGVPTRFIGYFEHVEMEMMAEAGLTPMQIIVSATKNAAEYLGLKNLGTLSRGNKADFVILNADPSKDIKNTRHIFKVYINGSEVKSKDQ